MPKPARTQRTRRKNNPWEVLVVAALFFFPGLLLLLQREPLVAGHQSFRWVPSIATVLTPHVAHIFGILAMTVALGIVWFYFRLRSEIRRDENAGIRYPN
jgi:hypothetical protein